MHTPQSLGRREFLRGVGAAAALTAGGSTLAACGSGKAAAVNKAGNAAQVQLPAYTPLANGPKPDLPGTDAGVPAGFYSYPASPTAAFASPPLSGGKFSAMTPLFTAPPPARGSNPAWQAVEKKLGASVDITMVVGDDFDTKLSTLIAGGGLPDLIQYDGLAGIPTISNLPQFLDSQIADLTEIIGGDKVKDYPHLAAIPKVFWEQCTVAGRLYFIPIPRGISAGAGLFRQDLFAAAGVNSSKDIKNSDDFFTLLKELTNPGKDRYALAGNAGNGGYSGAIFEQIFGVPNKWRLDGGGKLTADIETDEFKTALEFMVKVAKAGCFYPGSQGWTKAKMEDAFQSGKAALIYDGLPALSTSVWATARKIDPNAKLLPFVPFGATGGPGVAWQDNVVFAGTMLKKADPAKLADVMKLADFLAAPFGTEEYLLKTYGVEGTDYTLDADHNPVQTAQGKNDANVTWKYIAAPQLVTYNPGVDDLTDAVHQAYTELVPIALKDPTATLYSPTYSKQGVALYKAVSDTVTQVIGGQSGISAFDDVLKTRRSNGGDQIRSEFEQAYASAPKS